MTTLLVWAAVVLDVGLIAALVLVDRRQHRALQAMRAAAARYPLFAARDRLVSLVASGIMSANLPAWRRAYTTAARLLRRHEKLDVYTFFTSYTEYLLSLPRRPDEQARLAAIEAELKSAAKQVPDFGAALREMERAYLMLVVGTSNDWHNAKTDVYLALFKLRLYLSAGRSVPARRIVHPEVPQLAAAVGA